MHTVTDAYTARGLELKRKTALEWAGPCPVCGGTDRFTVFVEQDGGRGTWYCRGCDKGGDLIEFYRHCEGMGYREACRAAGQEAAAPDSGLSRRPAPENRGLTVKREEVGSEAPRADVPDRALWRQKAQAFVNACALKLTPDSPAGRWLAARGLPPESWLRYGLGYHPGENGQPHAMRARKGWGLPEGEPPRKNGKVRRALWLPRGIVIPRLSPQHVERLRIRRNNADLTGSLRGMKYYVIPGSDMTPLLLPCRGGVLPPDTCAVVVEAELDAMAVHHAAGDLALCLGVMTAKLRHLPEAQLDALRRCAVILVAMDYGDADGAGRKGWRIWRETFPQARRWPVPRGKDPGEAFALGVDLRAWVTAGLPPALADMAMRTASKAGMDGMTGAEKKVDVAVAAAPEQDRAGRLQSAHEARRERLAYLREWYPLNRLYVAHEVEALRLCLEGHGLRVVPVGDDYRIIGHEKWPGERFARLLRFVHMHGELIRRLALEQKNVVS